MTAQERRRLARDVTMAISGHLLQDLNSLANSEGPGARSFRAARDRVATALEMLGSGERAAGRDAKEGGR